MKLPFSGLLGPVLKPYLHDSSKFCTHPCFSYSILYTIFYSILGLCISANHLKKHLGETPSGSRTCMLWSDSEFDQNFMFLHDLKIIVTSMGVVQYICLLAGCYTENPALFMPHLIGQSIIIIVKMVSAVSMLTPIMEQKSMSQLKHKIPAIVLMSFNWLQEFCVFRRYLCICDL